MGNIFAVVFLVILALLGIGQAQLMIDKDERRRKEDERNKKE